jgi:hypothetical protein
MATKYVNDTSGNDSNNGDSAATAYKTIARAVDQISSGTGTSTKNTIVVHSGTYTEGPIDGSAKDFISLTTAGDGLVSIKHAGNAAASTYTIKVGDNWDITGNGLDIALFTKHLHGAAASTSGPVYAVFHGGSNNPFTASSVAFVGQKHLRNDTTHTQDSFGEALYRPAGSASNCVFMHLSKVGGTRSAGKLSLMGSLIFNTGMTSSTGNGVYVPATTSDFINNTFSHCTGGAYLVRYPAAKMMNNLFADCTAYGVSSNAADNYFLDDDSTTIKGNAALNQNNLNISAASRLWETATPSNQMSGSITNLIKIPAAAASVAGATPGEVLFVSGKTVSEGGVAPGRGYANAIFHTLSITASVLPTGGKSTNFDGGLSSTLMGGEGITGRSIAATGPATDLFGNSWPDSANPPVGCFSKYVYFAKEPEKGREATELIDADFTINNFGEVRKSRFKNIDAAVFSETTKAVTNLRGRQTIYRVTTTKT